MRFPSIDQLDRVGRPLLRITGVVVLALIGLSIAAAFLFWAFAGREFPRLPGEALLLPLMTQGPQIVDQITRYLQRVVEIKTNSVPYGVPNIHGGPDAP